MCCQPKKETPEKPAEPEIISEIVKTENGDKKLAKAREGAKMPHGKILDLQDKEINTQTWQGNFLVINLWASWCKPCLTDTPLFLDAASRYPNARFISVSIDKNKADWISFVDENSWTGNHYWMGMDDSNPLYSFAYSKVDSDDIKGVHVTLPKYIIVSPEGVIQKANFSGPGTPVFRDVCDEYLL